MQPVRHILGALLLVVEEAEACGYRSLGVLCLEAKGDSGEELAEVTALFNERARADQDVFLRTKCVERELLFRTH